MPITVLNSEPGQNICYTTIVVPHTIQTHFTGTVKFNRVDVECKIMYKNKKIKRAPTTKIHTLKALDINDGKIN